MDARIGVDSEEMRAPTLFHHEPTQRHRGSSQSESREGPVLTPPQHLPPGSSPAAASVDSFSSYINKDAPLFQNRSSSPRPEDQHRDHSDPASQTESPRPQPRHIVTTPVVSRDAFRNQHWSDRDSSRAANGVMAIEHLHNTQHTRLSQPDEREHHRVAADEVESREYQRPHVPASPSPAIDVNRLSVSNLAQKNEEDDEEGSSYHDVRMRAPASVMADDSFESSASVLGDDSKGEIRRRRRTRPDEANLLAQVYAKNPFPDHETRLFLANRVGMSVRAVSVWFQNRRQAEKKRSGRYGGSGIALTNGLTAASEGHATQAPEESAAKASVAAVPQRKPFGTAAANSVAAPKRFDPQELKDLSSNNKENIPPWLTGKDLSGSLQQHLEKAKRSMPLAEKKEVLAPRPVTRDLRQDIGPQGVGIAAHRAEVDTQSVKAAAETEVAPSSKSSLSRRRSVPRFSLDDVLSGRSKSLRRAATEHGAPIAASASSEMEEEQLDTILPPPKLLSRASSSSSLSLLTTSGGRASIGNLDQRKTASPASASQVKDVKASLMSSLPPKLTAALQMQGIIAMQPNEDEQETASTAERQGLLQMMPSSSASSSEADALYGAGQTRDGEEDEERTLKMIAQRRAAKAQAAALAKAQAARQACKDAAIIPLDPGCADARQAIAQQAGSSSSSAVHVSGSSSAKKSAVVGLAPARQLSLDWAAGRDRSCTSALPNSIGGTRLSRSVSARQLSTPRPNESTPVSQQRAVASTAPESAPTQGKKRKSASSAGRRSLSATDLTRRLQEAKRKGDAAVRSKAPRKRPAASVEVQDENVNPAARQSAALENEPAMGSLPVPAAKRRRAQLEDAVLARSLPEPALPAKVHAPFGSSMSPMLSSRPFSYHSSFPSTSVASAPRGLPTMVAPSTPSGTSSLYAAPLSTRSDRFRAIGASPATSSLGRSISANYPSHRHNALPRPIASSARDRSWELPGPPSRGYGGSEELGWTPRGVRGESLSQPLPMTASTPSRVLGDRTNLAGGSSSGDSPFMHDDSGFFGSLSEDEEHHAQVQVAVKGKGPVSPRKASLRSMGGAGRADAGDDHQAAELLLGLGKSVSSRDGSSQ